MSQKLFYRERVPKEIVSDDGVQFISREFQDMLTKFGIRHQKTPLYHPIANVLCERFIFRALGVFLETARALNIA